MPRCSFASVLRLSLILSPSVPLFAERTVLVVSARDKKNGATLCKNRYDGSLFREILRYRTVISSGLIIRRQAGFH